MTRIEFNENVKDCTDNMRLCIDTGKYEEALKLYNRYVGFAEDVLVPNGTMSEVEYDLFIERLQAVPFI